MKKFLFLGALAALLLGTASCSNDMEPVMTGDGTVTFKVDLPGAIDSRAIADGTTATKLEVACYDASGNILADIQPTVKTDFVNCEATVTYKLVKGQKYNFSFFAHADGAPYTFVPGTTLDNCQFTVNNYTDPCNAENRDAFYAVLENYEVSAAETTVTLYRPFAQLNFGADDLAAAAAAGIVPSQSKVTVSNAATTFNLKSGESTGEAAVAYTLADLPSDPSTLTVEGTSYAWMEMCYFLVPGNEANVDVEMTVKTNGDNVVVPVTNVPVKKNHRTNIVGSLFTQDANFRIIIDQNFDLPDYDIDALGRPYVTDGKVKVGQYGEEYNTLAEAIAANTNGETIYLGKGTYDDAITVAGGESLSLASAGGLTANDVTITNPVNTEAGATLELTNVKVTSDAAGTASVLAEGEGTKVVLDGVETSGRRGVNAFDGAEVIIKNSKINAEIEDGSNYNRALNIADAGTKVTVENSEIRCDTHYAINYPSSADGTELTLTNCNIIGWAIVNIWGDNNTITIENCNMSSINSATYNADGWNNFAAVVTNADADNNTFNITNSKLNVKSTTGNKQYLMLLGGHNNVYNGANINIVGESTNTNGYILGLNQTGATYTFNFDNTVGGTWDGESFDFGD